MNKADFKEKEHFSFSELCDLVSFLRSPEGCSWDYAQTHKTIRNNFVEEAYEVCEGIDQGNNSLLCEELGDVLFQVLFHTDIAEKEGAFALGDVIDGIAKKMISRHPHVFDEKISGEDPLKNWEEVKKAEKGEKTLFDTLSRVSTAYPALKRAEKFIAKGGDLPLEKSEDPLMEYGAQFFDLVRRCKKEKIDPEEALNAYLNEILKNCTNYE